MVALVIGVLALLALIFLGQLFSGADPRALVKGLRYTGAGLLGVAALALITVERDGLAFLAGSMAWGLFTGGRVLPFGWGHGIRHRTQHGPAPGGGSSTSQASRVRTAWLELELDHDTGAMRGTVLEGRHKGRPIERMPQSALVELYRETAHADPESGRLLETYLDRRFGPGWRTASQESGERASQGNGRDRGRARPDGGMTAAEAYAVLGLAAGAGKEAIRAAHRKLMLQNHPDRGGSSYLAAKINEAKDVLLG